MKKFFCAKQSGTARLLWDAGSMPVSARATRIGSKSVRHGKKEKKNILASNGSLRRRPSVLLLMLLLLLLLCCSACCHESVPSSHTPLTFVFSQTHFVRLACSPMPSAWTDSADHRAVNPWQCFACVRRVSTRDRAG